MDRTKESIAEAFSRHDFASAFPHFAEDVTWNLVGGDQVVGHDAVVRKCEESAAYMSALTTRFESFRILSAGDAVVIESVASYVESGQSDTKVASCDIYEFADGRLQRITSYNVELAAT